MKPYEVSTICLACFELEHYNEMFGSRNGFLLFYLSTNKLCPKCNKHDMYIELYNRKSERKLFEAYPLNFKLLKVMNVQI